MTAYQNSLEVRMRNPAKEDNRVKDYFCALGTVLLEKMEPQRANASADLDAKPPAVLLPLQDQNSEAA